MTTPDVLERIRRASRPYGVAVQEALDLTARQRQRAVKAGVLTRYGRGVLLDNAVPRTVLRDLSAAVAAGRPYAAAAARSGCALFDLTEHPSQPEVVVPLVRYARIPGATVRRSTTLQFDDTMIWRHIRTLKPLVAVTSLGVVLSAMDLAEVLVRARVARLFEVEAFAATVARLARSGHDGIRTCREALHLVMIGDRPADSVLELRFHHGPGRSLPPYEYQYEVKVDGRRYRIDFAYPDVKVGIETDGLDKRKSQAALLHDAQKGRALLKAGWDVPHFTWPEINYHPDVVVSDVIAILCTAGYRFGR